jgi:hypothetical protein
MKYGIFFVAIWLGGYLAASEDLVAIEAKIAIFQSRTLSYQERLLRCSIIDRIHQAVVADHQSTQPFFDVGLKIVHLRTINRSDLPISHRVKKSLAQFLAGQYYHEKDACDALNHVGQVYKIYPLSIEKTIPIVRSLYQIKEIKELRALAHQKAQFQKVLQELQQTDSVDRKKSKLESLSDVCASSLSLLSVPQSGQKRKHSFSISFDNEDVYS